MIVARILAFVVPLAVGALLGAFLGSIITGGGGYVLVWSLGLPLVIVLFVALGFLGFAKRNAGPDAAPSRPIRVRRGIAAFLVIAGITATLIPAYPMIGWIASDVVQGRPFDGRDMRTGLHQNDAVAQIAEVVGSPDVTRVNFYDEYVIVSARSSPRSTTTDTYTWRNGEASRSGPGGFEPDLSELLFDASTIDFSVIPSLITIAKRDAGMNDAETYYPSVSRAPGGDGPGDPIISISLRSDYFDAYYTFSLDGEILSKSGSAFE